MEEIHQEKNVVVEIIMCPMIKLHVTWHTVLELPT